MRRVLGALVMLLFWLVVAGIPVVAFLVLSSLAATGSVTAGLILIAVLTIALLILITHLIEDY